MPKALRPCATPGCPNLTPSGTSRCPTCDTTRQADYRARRDPVTHAHYKSRGHARFRRRVLDRDPICVICHDAIATDADHWPLSLRQLLEQGLDPNDPSHGRGLCHSCHAKETSRLQPGGWNAAARDGGGGPPPAPRSRAGAARGTSRSNGLSC